MKSLALVFVSALALVIVNGNTLERTADSELLSDVFDWPVEDDDTFVTEDIDGLPYDSDDSFEELSVEDDEFSVDTALEPSSLMGCQGGKCEVCFKAWKLKGCFVVSLVSGGIKIEFKAFGNTMYSHTVKASGSFTLKVKRSLFPKALKKAMKGDLKIQVSGIDLAKKKLCVRIQVKVKWFGTVKWPLRSPQCFSL